MGIFSSKTKTYVSSVVYPLGEEPAERQNYLKTVLLGSVLSGSKKSLGQVVQNAMIGGPGRKQQDFFRWARTNYAEGIPWARLQTDTQVDAATVRAGLLPSLNLAANQELLVRSAIVGDGDIEHWAEEYIVQNYPDRLNGEWRAQWLETSQQIQIEIIDNDTVTTTVQIPGPSDLIWVLANRAEQRRLLFVLYQVATTDPVTGFVSSTPSTLYTYRIGSGNVSFDTLARNSTEWFQFYPIMPLRLNNVSVRDMGTGWYANLEDAYKKLTGRRIDDILDSIEDNPDIGDIDYCYLVQGVSLNTVEQVGLAYTYKFLLEIMASQTTTRSLFESYLRNSHTSRVGGVSWVRYLQSLGLGEAPRSDVVLTTMPSRNQLRLTTTLFPSFDQRIEWVYIDQTFHIGNGKTYDGNQTRGRMEVGDYWIIPLPDIRLSDVPAFTSANSNLVFTRFALFHQYSRFRYSRIDVVGMRHINYVYAGHHVSISSTEALQDPDESGFIVPLHYPTLRKLSPNMRNELAAISGNLVFNCYVQRKKKWYQRGIFKILLVIGIAIISIYIPPLAGGVAGGAGILGSNLVLGITLGATTAVMATIVGAIANAIVAVLISTVIQNVSTNVFGDELGAVIGVIATFVAFTYASNYATVGNFNVDWSQVLRMDNLMQVTDVVTRAYSSWIQVDTKKAYEEMQELQGKYTDESQRIKEKAAEILGVTDGEIDPMILTSAVEHFVESHESFLHRTLLTASDFIQLSEMMIEDFAEVSLELPLAFA